MEEKRLKKKEEGGREEEKGLGDVESDGGSKVEPFQTELGTYSHMPPASKSVFHARTIPATKVRPPLTEDNLFGAQLCTSRCERRIEAAHDALMTAYFDTQGPMMQPRRLFAGPKMSKAAFVAVLDAGLVTKLLPSWSPDDRRVLHRHSENSGGSARLYREVWQVRCSRGDV